MRQRDFCKSRAGIAYRSVRPRDAAKRFFLGGDLLQKVEMEIADLKLRLVFRERENSL